MILKNYVMNDELKVWFDSEEYEKAHEAFDKIQKDIVALTEPFQSILKEFEDIMEPMRKAINEIVDRISKSVLSDADKKRVKAVAKRLADNDIVITPDEGPFYFYDFKPTKKNIKELYESYSSGKRFKELVESIMSFEVINKQYCFEAIKCYKKKCYLACSSLLFSVIDSHFIAKNKLNEKRQRRTLNQQLAVECLNDIEKETSFEYFFLIQSNALLMLSKYYSHGKDFKEEPLYVNRSFVDHGMVKRKVTRQDCIKLFILCSYLEMV